MSSLNIKAVEFIPDSKSSFEAYVHNTFNEMKNEIKQLQESLKNSKTKISKLENLLSNNHQSKLDAIYTRIEDITPECQKCHGDEIRPLKPYIGECGNTVKDWITCECVKSKKEFNKIMNGDDD
jgi:uncharacterized protein YlxW (UPF0749 family)